jgi:hypothetical protein
LLQSSDRLRLKQWGARCLEGWRVSTNPQSADYDVAIEFTPIYRQANLDVMRFRLDREHWQSPKRAWNPAAGDNEWCVQPGDIVLNKLIPIHAAWVTDRVYRHPVDANCMIIRGLNRCIGLWVATCLNQTPYEAYLTQRQGLAILPRASLSGLRHLRLPEPPGEMEPLSQTIWDLNDELIETEAVFIRLMEEVETYIKDESLVLADETEMGFRLGFGTDARPLNPGRFFPAASIEDSLLPIHAENAYLRYHLDRDLKWIPLSKISVAATASPDRLGDGEQPSRRHLKLKDVGDDLFLPDLEKEPVQKASRLFAQPLEKGEVLISKLVTSPSIVFVDQQPEAKIYVTDNWHRLRFDETPGAWALILNTSAIREQLAGMGMGSIQQFTYVSQIEQLRVPDVAIDLRQQWAKVLGRYLDRKRSLVRRWNKEWDYAKELFQRCHELPFKGKRINF